MDPVNSISDRNLGVCAITKITAKNAGAVPPTHLVTRMPNSVQSLATAPRADYAVDSP
jgi:hypothetical protein